MSTPSDKQIDPVVAAKPSPADEPNPVPGPEKSARAARRADRRDHRSDTGFGGVVLVLIGLVFLGINYGWWTADAWQTLWRFWPAWLILLGIRLLLPRNRIFSWAILAVGIGLLAVAAANPPLVRTWTSPGPTNQSAQNLSSELGATKQLNLALTYGAAEVTVKPLAGSSTELYRADFSNTPSIQKQESTSGGITTITLSEAAHGMMMWGSVPRQADLAITPKVPLDLTLHTGGAQLRADLRGLQLENFTFEGGATNADIQFGTASANIQVAIHAGASSLTLRAPTATGLQIHFDSGLTSQNFEAAGLQKTGTTYQTPNYASSPQKINIELDAGASSVNLERYN